MEFSADSIVLLFYASWQLMGSWHLERRKLRHRTVFLHFQKRNFYDSNKNEKMLNSVITNGSSYFYWFKFHDMTYNTNLSFSL